MQIAPGAYEDVLRQVVGEGRIPTQPPQESTHGALPAVHELFERPSSPRRASMTRLPSAVAVCDWSSKESP